MSGFQIIQGGMGVGVSNWQLARAVAGQGQLGVVSGTGVSVVLARRLQNGDPDGQMRRALTRFPLRRVAQRIIERYFVDFGKPQLAPFLPMSPPALKNGPDALDLLVAGNFVEVWLAREHHAEEGRETGPVGINYLEKIQCPHLPSFFGAMLGGVDYVLMGAGIPRYVPGALDALAAGKEATYRLDVDDLPAGCPDEYISTFDPMAWWNDPERNPEGLPFPKLTRPKFFAIISSATLAMTLARKSNGRVDGFVVEGHTAGGHNAPPRGPMQLTDRGEPQYGPRDNADLDKIRALGLPFYLAGGWGRPGKLAEALQLGAAGIQVGTAFAFCEESGIAPELKKEALRLSRDQAADIFTDPAASPTGFPIKLLQLEGTLSDDALAENRTRVCDLGFLRKPFRRPDGTLGYRCAAEPIEQYVKKGGTEADAAGRKCLCNALFANIGMGQRRCAEEELPLITAGNDTVDVQQFAQPGCESYTAADVIRTLLAPVEAAEPCGAQKQG
jgi:nitronate monooxygenase